MTIRSTGDVHADALQKQLDEADELFRQIAEVAGDDGTTPGEWRAITQPPRGVVALNAVRELRRDYDEVCDLLDRF